MLSSSTRSLSLLLLVGLFKFPAGARTERSMDEMTVQSFHNSNSSIENGKAAVSGWKCPSQCSQCCEPDVLVGKKKKFKCVLRNADELPEGRKCGKVQKRRSSPAQSKVDCEFTEEEGENKQPQCSKQTRCCCSRSQLSVLHKFQKAKLDTASDAFCAPYTRLEEGKQFSHSKANVVEIFELEKFWSDDIDQTCHEGFDADTGTFYSRYRRAVLMSGGFCFTDRDGLQQDGKTFYCPDDMMESDPNEKINCLCDDDC